MGLVSECDFEAARRLVSWLSFHIGNLQFKAKWKQWEEQAKSDTTGRCEAFLRSIVEKCTLLGERPPVTAAIPESLHKYFPPQNAFQFPESETPAAKELMALFSQPERDKLVSEWLEKAESDGMITPESGLELLCKCCFNFGTASYQHMTSILKEFGTLVRSMAQRAGGPGKVLAVAESCFSLAQVQFNTLAERLMTSKVVAPRDVVEFCFTPEQIANLANNDRWDLVTKAFSVYTAGQDFIEEHIKKAEKDGDERMLSNLQGAAAKNREEMFKLLRCTLELFARALSGDVPVSGFMREQTMDYSLFLVRRFFNDFEDELGAMEDVLRELHPDIATLF